MTNGDGGFFMSFHSISTCDVPFQTFIFTNATKVQRCGGQCQGAPKGCRLGQRLCGECFIWLRDLRIGLLVDVFSWHPSHFISFHLISSHFISFHLISSHFISFLSFRHAHVFESVPKTNQIEEINRTHLPNLAGDSEAVACTASADASIGAYTASRNAGIQVRVQTIPRIH